MICKFCNAELIKCGSSWQGNSGWITCTVLTDDGKYQDHEPAEPAAAPQREEQIVWRNGEPELVSVEPSAPAGSTPQLTEWDMDTPKNNRFEPWPLKPEAPAESTPQKCETCQGKGVVLDIGSDLVVDCPECDNPNPSLPRGEWIPCPICQSDYDGQFCHACRNIKPEANNTRPEIIETLKQAAEKAIEQGDDLSPEWLLKLLASDTRPDPLRDKNPIAMAANEIADFYNQNATMIPQPHHIEAILFRHLAAAPRTQGSEPLNSELLKQARKEFGDSRHCTAKEAIDFLERKLAAQPQPSPRQPVCPKCGHGTLAFNMSTCSVICDGCREVTRLTMRAYFMPLSDFAQFFTAIPAQKEEPNEEG